MPRTSASLTVGIPFGDVYSSLANDGADKAGSLSATLDYSVGRALLKIDYRRSVYETENSGPGTRTSFGTLDGGQAAVPYFNAVESDVEARLETQLFSAADVYAGVGAMSAMTNYSYPQLLGLGIGLERPVASGSGHARALFFWSAFYYPSLEGTYIEENPESPHFGRRYGVDFAVVKTDLGVSLCPRAARACLVAGYANELRQGRHLPAYSSLVRSEPYLAVRLTI
jgi:hypothetical protein